MKWLRFWISHHSLQPWQDNNPVQFGFRRGIGNPNSHRVVLPAAQDCDEWRDVQEVNFSTFITIRFGLKNAIR